MNSKTWKYPVSPPNLNANLQRARTPNPASPTLLSPPDFTQGTQGSSDHIALLLLSGGSQTQNSITQSGFANAIALGLTPALNIVGMTQMEDLPFCSFKQTQDDFEGTGRDQYGAANIINDDYETLESFEIVHKSLEGHRIDHETPAKSTKTINNDYITPGKGSEVVIVQESPRMDETIDGELDQNHQIDVFLNTDIKRSQGNEMDIDVEHHDRSTDFQKENVPFDSQSSLSAVRIPSIKFLDSSFRLGVNASLLQTVEHHTPVKNSKLNSLNLIQSKTKPIIDDASSQNHSAREMVRSRTKSFIDAVNLNRPKTPPLSTPNKKNNQNRIIEEKSSAAAESHHAQKIRITSDKVGSLKPVENDMDVDEETHETQELIILPHQSSARTEILPASLLMLDPLSGNSNTQLSIPIIPTTFNVQPEKTLQNQSPLKSNQIAKLLPMNHQSSLSDSLPITICDRKCIVCSTTFTTSWIIIANEPHCQKCAKRDNITAFTKPKPLVSSADNYLSKRKNFGTGNGPLHIVRAVHHAPKFDLPDTQPLADDMNLPALSLNDEDVVRLMAEPSQETQQTQSQIQIHFNPTSHIATEIQSQNPQNDQPKKTFKLIPSNSMSLVSDTVPEESSLAVLSYGSMARRVVEESDDESVDALVDPLANAQQETKNNLEQSPTGNVKQSEQSQNLARCLNHSVAEDVEMEPANESIDDIKLYTVHGDIVMMNEIERIDEPAVSVHSDSESDCDNDLDDDYSDAKDIDMIRKVGDDLEQKPNSIPLNLITPGDTQSQSPNEDTSARSSPVDSRAQTSIQSNIETPVVDKSSVKRKAKSHPKSTKKLKLHHALNTPNFELSSPMVRSVRLTKPKIIHGLTDSSTEPDNSNDEDYGGSRLSSLKKEIIKPKDSASKAHGFLVKKKLESVTISAPNSPSRSWPFATRPPARQNITGGNEFQSGTRVWAKSGEAFLPATLNSQIGNTASFTLSFDNGASHFNLGTSGVLSTKEMYLLELNVNDECIFSDKISKVVDISDDIYTLQLAQSCNTRASLDHVSMTFETLQTNLISRLSKSPPNPNTLLKGFTFYLGLNDRTDDDECTLN